MQLYKTGLTLRGDMMWCPLALQLSTYFNCEANCRHCYLRRLNRTWGTDLRPLDIEVLKKQVSNGLKNTTSTNPLAVAIRSKKTIYCGAKSDCYQDAELQYRATFRALSEVLLPAGFTVVIATMFTKNLLRDYDLFKRYRNQIIIMPIVSPGLEKDWSILERERTTHPLERLEAAAFWQKEGFKVGINGEPYIGGFHTIEEFERVCVLISELGIKSYNIYNLHANDYNLKAMHDGGIDIEKVWEENQDANWKKTLQKLIQIAQKYDIVLGCPDFVNAGEYSEKVNTCCGFDVPNPCTFNLITWKKLRARGMSDEQIIECTWDGVGDKEEGRRLLAGGVKELYTLDDIKRDDGKLI